MGDSGIARSMIAGETLKRGMPPIAGRETRLFILGSLPGDASIAAQHYYAHPTNQFWRLLGEALSEPLAEFGHEARIARLAERKIGLWDVVAVAERAGSLDGAIRNAAPNPIATLLLDYPKIEAIAFNGKAAARAGRRMLGKAGNVVLIDLPSSSAAFTWPFADKAAVWRALADHCDGGFSAGEKGAREG